MSGPAAAPVRPDSQTRSLNISVRRTGVLNPRAKFVVAEGYANDGAGVSPAVVRDRLRDACVAAAAGEKLTVRPESVSRALEALSGRISRGARLEFGVELEDAAAQLRSEAD